MRIGLFQRKLKDPANWLSKGCEHRPIGFTSWQCIGGFPPKPPGMDLQSAQTFHSKPRRLRNTNQCGLPRHSPFGKRILLAFRAQGIHTTTEIFGFRTT